MEGQDAVEIDPEIAAAMGFGSFGSQPKDKRKYHSENAYVDPSVSATGANSQTVVSAAKKATDEIDDDAPKDDSNQERGKHVTKNPSEATLEELANGVRNEKGDIVYFMPSFIEDPWKDFPEKPRKGK